MADLDALRARAERGDPFCPHDAQAGIRMEAAGIDRGTARVAMEVGPSLHNPKGVLHGGILSALGDSSMGLAMYTILDEDEDYTSIDLQIRFLRPTVTGRLTADGTVVKEGRRICLVEFRIHDDQGRLVSRGESAFMRLGRRRDAAAVASESPHND